MAAVECLAALAAAAVVAEHVAPALADADESVRCAALLALRQSDDANVRVLIRYKTLRFGVGDLRSFCPIYAHFSTKFGRCLEILK